MNFYERFVGLCNKVGKTPSRVAVEVGLSKPTVNRWKNGSTPTDATAMKIAEYFGVSIQELTGEGTLGDLAYEVCRDQGLVESPFENKKESTVTVDDGLSERMKASQRKLIEYAKKLPEEEVELLLRQAELLVQMMESMNGDAQQ